MTRFCLFLALAVLQGCVTSPPSNVADVCSIFEEKDDWYDSALAAYKRWGAPIHVQMAIINQESSFVADVQPDRVHFLGIPLWWRPTSAYGYTQALDMTWNDYVKATGNYGADRDDFADATDFVGWYMKHTTQSLAIPGSDAYRQYLAYHEGQKAYRRGRWKSKPALMRAARHAATFAARYKKQLRRCQPSLASGEDE
jgi:hypothetical protein